MQTLSETPPGRVLVVDDEPEIVAFVRELLSNRGYRVLGLSDSREASDQLDLFRPDVCVFDFRMPHVSGADLLDIAKKKDPKIEVIFLTAEIEAGLAVNVMKRGALDYLLKPVELNQLVLSVGRAMEHRTLVIENEQYRQQLEQLVRDKTMALNQALTSLKGVHTETLEALSLALDYRDQSTSGHSRRVADLTAGAANMMDVKDAALVQIHHGALLHDIGKLKIPDSILFKPSRLTAEEWRTMRRHAEYGYEFLRNVEFLKDAAEIVYAHHEKFDGTGYPRGLRGTEIPFGARVFMIVDTVDAMIYKRPYNNPVKFTDAAEEVRRCSGTQFDPNLVEPTLAYLDKHIPPELR
jgi:putative nucleotidyltransferase with HDIG domain